MYEDFSFERPYFLLLIVLFALSSKYFKPMPESYYIPYIVQYLPHVDKKKYIKLILKWAIFIFAIIALSTPVVERSIKTLNDASIDIVLSLDTSGSMSSVGFSEQDPDANRWEVVTALVKEFMSTRDKDRIALVIFGSSTAVVSPLSYDHEIQKDLLDNVNIGSVGRSTALIDSIFTSITLLKNTKSKSKIIILVSDGDDSMSKVPLAIVLKLAKKYDVKIYPISIGESNNNMLEYIANENGTKKFNAVNKEDLDDVYAKINSLQKVQLENNTIRIKEHIYFYFLAISLLSSFLLLFITRKEEGF